MEETTFQVELVNGTHNQNNNLFRTSTSQTKISILGKGNYGNALATRLFQAGVNCVIGSRYPINEKSNETKTATYDEAINTSDIIFLCIPAHAYENTISPLKSLLIGKTIVEISNLEKENDPSNALRLQDLIPSTHVLKALNTVSAYALEHDTHGASRDTYVCGDSDERKKQLMAILREIGLNPLDRGPLRTAPMIEKLSFRFFHSWGTAMIITVATLIPILFYTYLKYFWHDDQSKRTDEDLGAYVANRTIAWLMFWLLALTYLPGVLAGFIHLFAGTKYIRFPNWLDRWMKCRKQLGLICLLLASIHGCLSCLLLGASEVKHMLIQSKILLSGKSPIVLYQNLNTTNQLSLLFATLSLALMAILGIASLPSVNARMSWREWDFVQRGLGFTCLIFGFLHVILYVYHLWDPEYIYGWKKWVKDPKGIYPPGAFVMPMFPLLVIGLKFFLMLPGLSCYLNRIRNGKVGYKRKKNVIAA